MWWRRSRELRRSGNWRHTRRYRWHGKEKKMPDRGCTQSARPIQTRWMLAVIVVSVLSGCTVGPDYQRPALPSPAVFRGTAEPAISPDPHSLGDLQWFEVFQDTQLQALIQTALVSNYDLRDAVARVDEARANL